MNLAHAEILFYLWALPLVGAILWFGLSQRKKRLEKLAPLGDLFKNQNIPALKGGRAYGVALILGMGLLLVSLAGPRWSFQWREVKTKGVEIMVALDVSRSMLAQDIKPNRLQRARREIIDLINMLQGDKVGLVAFAGVGFVQCPLTVDYNAVRLFLNNLDEDLIPVQGTSLGDAIRLGVESLTSDENSEASGKAIILITDGEDQSSQPLKEAEKAKAAGVKVFTIGIGAREGAPIPVKGGGFKKDRSGNVIVSKLDESTLREIASLTGGIYVRSTSGDMDLETIYLNNIRAKMEESEFSRSREKLWDEQHTWFSLLAFLILLIR